MKRAVLTACLMLAISSLAFGQGTEVYQTRTRTDAALYSFPRICPTTGTALPAPTSWNVTANLHGDLRLEFKIPVDADYRDGYLEMWVDEIADRSYLGGLIASGMSFLNGALTPDATTMTLHDVAAFRVGGYARVGLEAMKIMGPGLEGDVPTSLTVDIARAQLGSTAGSADDQGTVTPLEQRVFHFSLPPGYTLAHPTIDHVEKFRPGAMLIAHSTLQFDNGFGRTSEKLERGFHDFISSVIAIQAGALPGLRVFKGEHYELRPTSGGPLRVGTDLFDPLTLGPGDGVAYIYAEVDRASGGGVQGQIHGIGIVDGKVGDTPWVVGDIAIVSQTVDGITNTSGTARVTAVDGEGAIMEAVVQEPGQGYIYFMEQPYFGAVTLLKGGAQAEAAITVTDDDPNAVPIVFQPLLDGEQIVDALFGPLVPVVGQILGNEYSSGVIWRGDFYGNQSGRRLGVEILQAGGASPGEGFRLIVVR